MGDIHRCLALLFSWTAATLIKNTGTSQKPWEPYGMKMLTAGVQNAIASHGCSGSHFRAGDGVVQS